MVDGFRDPFWQGLTNLLAALKEACLHPRKLADSAHNRGVKENNLCSPPRHCLAQDISTAVKEQSGITK